MTEEIHAGCGGVIVSIVKTSYPPIACKKCSKCGAETCEPRQEIKQVEVTL